MISRSIAAVRGIGDAGADRRAAVEHLLALAADVVAVVPQSPALLVVPVGAYALMPFAAAPMPDGRALVDHSTVSQAPSLGWACMSRRARPTGKAVGVFAPGDPPLVLDADRRSFEATTSGRSLHEPTAQSVLGALDTTTSVGHFSCHGAYDAQRPTQSFLALTTPLTIEAVLAHGAAPWLVNLSACETAMPDLRALEQILSFPTAFLLGGAAHVVASLWPIGDAEAAEVNRAMYDELAAGEHPAAALRTAVTSLRDELTDGDPTAVVTEFAWWAAFVHYGAPW